MNTETARGAFLAACTTYFRAVAELPAQEAQTLDLNVIVLRYRERDRLWSKALEAYKAISNGVVEGES